MATENHPPSQNPFGRTEDYPKELKELVHYVRQRLDERDELRFLLRQVFYARCPIGTKLCDELDRWQLEDLHERILRALGDIN